LKPPVTLSHLPMSRSRRRGRSMNEERRFFVDKKGYVVDTINPANSAQALADDEDQNDRMLRERLLQVRLNTISETLFFTPTPMKTLPDGTEYQPLNEDALSTWWPIFRAIKASQLNWFDVGISIQNRFNGLLKRKKHGLGDFTSLSLFCDDVEYTLRDLYGDIDDEALESILSAVFCIVDGFTGYARKDLYQEHHAAVAVDAMHGIGWSEGYGITGSMWRAGMAAAQDLAIRAPRGARYPICI
jgi:hypothetical protein